MIKSPEEFIALRTSTQPDEYRRAVNEEAPMEVWNAVLDSHPEMHEWVAHNKTIPLELIERLAVSSSARVRLTIAMKRRTPAGVLTMLARDPDDAVRMAVARHPKVSDDSLRILQNDPVEAIRQIASSRR